MAIQFTCPYCKKEFPFNNGKLDMDICNLTQRINETNRRIAELKIYYQSPEIKKEKKKLGLELRKMAEEMSRLKTIRKSVDENKHKTEYGIFKQLVREKMGDEQFMKLIEERDELMKAYKVGDTMQHDYTRSNHLSSVTSINKL